jgi:acyl-CoA synthetase (AMP-forming)/AMP-acid ligase II
LNAPEEILERFAAARAAIERAEAPPDIFTLFDRAAARYADRTLWAPADPPADPPGETLTYRAFAEHVRRAAGVLEGLGVGPGTHVALMLPNVPAFAAIWMALARAGAVLVAVNTRFTARELAFVLQAGDAELLVIDRRFLPVLAEIPASSLPLPPARIVVHGVAAPGYGAEWNARAAVAAPTPPSSTASSAPISSAAR